MSGIRRSVLRAVFSRCRYALGSSTSCIVQSHIWYSWLIVVCGSWWDSRFLVLLSLFEHLVNALIDAVDGAKHDVMVVLQVEHLICEV